MWSCHMSLFDFIILVDKLLQNHFTRGIIQWIDSWKTQPSSKRNSNARDHSVPIPIHVILQIELGHLRVVFVTRHPFQLFYILVCQLVLLSHGWHSDKVTLFDSQYCRLGRVVCFINTHQSASLFKHVISQWYYDKLCILSPFLQWNADKTWQQWWQTLLTRQWKNHRLFMDT